MKTAENKAYKKFVLFSFFWVDDENKWGTVVRKITVRNHFTFR